MSGEHSALLDALEEAGFPRSALEGGGNALVWDLKDARGVFHRVLIAPVANDPSEIEARFSTPIRTWALNRAQARELGAFLLAWGYGK